MGILKKLVVGSLAAGAVSMAMGNKKVQKAAKSFAKSVQKEVKAQKAALTKAGNKKVSAAKKVVRKKD